MARSVGSAELSYWTETACHISLRSRSENFIFRVVPLVVVSQWPPNLLGHLGYPLPGLDEFGECLLDARKFFG